MPREPDRNCRACGRPLIFAKGANGRLIPLDAATVVYKLQVNVLTGEATARASEDCYVSHFATCPHASSFSKKD